MVMFKNLSLKVKLIALFLVVGLVPLLVGVVISYNSSSAALQTETFNKLVSIRELKKEQIESYFKTIENQVLSFSEDVMIVDAMKSFKAAFNSIGNDPVVSSDELESYRSSVSGYYTGGFASTFREKSVETIDAGSLVPTDKNSLILQYRYISNNSNPMGSKNGLVKADDGSYYSELHARYHPAINTYLEKFGFYDIFLVDPDTGNVVYSVFKEVDYATSLKHGPYANTNFAAAFKRAAKAGRSDVAILEDFKAYAPSFNSPASFMASPIYDKGKLEGVLVFQMPVGAINEIMTSGKRWNEVGLGDSGESYIVGADFKLRNDSRFLIDDKPGYLSILREKGFDKNDVDTIEKLNTSILFQDVKSETARAAIAGNSGFKIIPDYRDVPVLSAYSPLKIAGVNWGILAEIDEAEAFAPLTALKKLVIIMTVIILGIVVVIAWFVAKSISLPVIHVAEMAAKVAAGDLTVPDLQVKNNDEIGSLVGALNNMKSRLNQMMGQITTMADHVAAASTELSATSTQIVNGIDRQSNQTNQVATAMEEMSATVVEVAKNSQGASEASGDTQQIAVTGGDVVKKAVDGMMAVAETVRGSAETVEALGKSSDEIGAIISVINDIADQTNLLALNAAIEAARAGEQGRGFAVVADEVRKLAEKTTKATKEIADMIKTIQNDTKGAMSSMHEGTKQVEEGVQLASEAGESLQQIVSSVDRVTDMVRQIATAAEEQSATSEEISSNISGIAEVANENSEGVKQVSIATEDLAKVAEELKAMVSEFKITKVSNERTTNDNGSADDADTPNLRAV
jgi:methyl-accepting chemotaxis protein